MATTMAIITCLPCGSGNGTMGKLVLITLFSIVVGPRNSEVGWSDAYEGYADITRIQSPLSSIQERQRCERALDVLN